MASTFYFDLRFLLDELPDRISVVFDSRLPQMHVDECLMTIREQLGENCAILSVPGGESIKTQNKVEELWAEWLAKDVTRSSLIVAIGGGSITDLVGYAASTFKRGIRWVAMPTTLLGMVDAAIGGKTGINILGIKNLVGTFCQPVAVIPNAIWLRSLPEIEIWNGWMEMTKHALIHSELTWQNMEMTHPLELSSDALFDLAEKSGQIKKIIVQSDPYEKGERKILNLGHTLGHALEATSQSSSGRNMPHGIAVGWGLCFALQWSCEKTEHPAKLENAQATIQKWLEMAGWGATSGLPDVESLWRKMKQDKKNRGDDVLDVRLIRMGQAEWDIPLHRRDFNRIWSDLS
ncbi:MAG: 3-dehydroquinate synthase [Flavobacteriales bacterium]